jgi:hypothetical protein
MKQASLLTSAIIILIVFIAAGCSKNDGVLGPNGLNSQVTFRISQQQGINGGTEFLFTPGVDLNVSRIVLKYNAEQYTDTLKNNNTSYVFSKDTSYVIGEYTGVAAGQQWNFDFTGTVPGQINPNYSVTVNYTVQ